MSHTPGPWRIGNLVSYDGYTGRPYRNVWVGDDDDAFVVARAIENGDVDANAHLIAAAPETTDSLEEICNLIAAGNDLTFAPLAAAIIKARGAIAKARGAMA